MFSRLFGNEMDPAAQAQLMMGASMLAQSGPSMQPVGGGEILGNAFQTGMQTYGQAQQAQQAQQEAEAERQRREQMMRMFGISPDGEAAQGNPAEGARPAPGSMSVPGQSPTAEQAAAQQPQGPMADPVSLRRASALSFAYGDHQTGKALQDQANALEAQAQEQQTRQQYLQTIDQLPNLTDQQRTILRTMSPEDGMSVLTDTANVGAGAQHVNTFTGEQVAYSPTARIQNAGAGLGGSESDHARERHIQDAMNTLNMDRAEAVRYVDNYRDEHLVTDPVTGRHAVRDRRTGDMQYAQPRQPDELDRSWEPLVEPGTPKESGDPAQVTGLRGAMWRSLNRLSGALGREPAQADVEQAEVSLGRLQDESKIILSQRVSGRPSNYLLEMLDNMTFSPREVLTGDQRAYRQLSQFRDNVDEQAQRERTVLENPYHYKQDRVQEAQENLRELNDLRQSYDMALEMFGTTRDAAGGRPEDMPRIQSDEEFDNLPSGTRFIDPDGNVRRKP